MGRPRKKPSRVLGESSETFGNAMVSLCQEAEGGYFFGEPIEPTLLRYAHHYTDEQCRLIQEAGFELKGSEVPTQAAQAAPAPPNAEVVGAGSSSSGGEEDALSFWGLHGKRKLIERLQELAGRKREFRIRKSIGDALLKQRKTAITVVFGCNTCRIRFACSLERLASPDLTRKDFRCLCMQGFTYRDALGRKEDVAYRNLQTYVATQLPDTDLVTTHGAFKADRSSVLLSCRLCSATRRLLPRDVFDHGARCACCADNDRILED